MKYLDHLWLYMCACIYKEGLFFHEHLNGNRARDGDGGLISSLICLIRLKISGGLNREGAAVASVGDSAGKQHDAQVL